jgi:hypothetical protein
MIDKNSPSLQLIRVILSHYGDIEEWRLGDSARAAAKGYPRTYDGSSIDDYGIVFVDLAVEESTGALICYEVNGPNAIGSDALTGDSFARAENESLQTLQRLRDFGYLQSDGRLNTPVVTLHAHTNWNLTRSLGEFYPRVLSFADILREMLPGNAMALRGAGEELGSEKISVVSGEVRSVAENTRVDPVTGGFTYNDRPVVFAGNPNLLPELVRTGKLVRDGADYSCADLRVFHAWRLATTVHNRSLQQTLLSGTAIKPIPCFESNTVDGAFATTKRMLSGGAVVIKPNGCSGGTGVHVAVPGMSDDEIRARIHAVAGDCVAKYGVNADTQILPIRCFPFVRSTLYPMADGGHTWDLRIAVMFEPGSVAVYPVSMRIAPNPFDAERFQHERGQWVTNVSGNKNVTAASTAALKSGMDDDALRAVGLNEEKLERALAAAAAWTVKAWAAAPAMPTSAKIRA